jgi:hypothetical protein
MKIALRSKRVVCNYEQENESKIWRFLRGNNMTTPCGSCKSSFLHPRWGTSSMQTKSLKSFSLWRWRRYVSPKRLFLQDPNGVIISQKAAFFKKREGFSYSCSCRGRSQTSNDNIQTGWNRTKRAVGTPKLTLHSHFTLWGWILVIHRKGLNGH